MREFERENKKRKRLFILPFLEGRRVILAKGVILAKEVVLAEEVVLAKGVILSNVMVSVNWSAQVLPDFPGFR